MANNHDPQPSTSTGQGQMVRTDTSSTVPPLTDEELKALKAELNGFGGDTPNASLIQSQQNSQQNLVSNWSDLRDNPMDRRDTLDRNPKCIDPNDLQISANDIKVENNRHNPLQTTQIFTTNQTIQVTQPQQNTQIPQFVVTTLPTQNVWEDPATTITFGPEDLNLLQNNTGNNYIGPTSTSPCIDEFPGDSNFHVSFDTLSASSKTKHWDYSHTLKKLFIDMNKYVRASFHLGPNPPEGLMIRALPIYAVAGFFTAPVRRCPNHAAHGDPSNRDPMWQDKREHLIRVDDDFCMYEEDPESKRLYVMIPVQPPQTGSTSFAVPLKFMCLGSDVGGINRKPLKVVFTLEHGIGNVIARTAVDVRICSCPKRDKVQEEKKHEEDIKKSQKVGDGLARANSSLVMTRPPPEKKRKIDSAEDMIFIPVAKCDFEYMNKIAESLQVARHTAKEKEIKELRKRLIRQHNPNAFMPPPKPKPEHPR